MTEMPMQTVPVHVVNAHELLKPQFVPEHQHAPDSPDIAVITQTFTLKTSQTSDPNDSAIQRVLDRDPGRMQALIVVTSGTVYLCHSRAQAQAALGSASTIGTAQGGFLVAAGQYVPPLRTTDPLWAVVPTDKAGAGAQVSVLTETRRARG
jgi:hypothetical protein